MTVVVHLTAAQGHATELMHNLDLASTDMVLSVGGDGTLYEGLQVGGASLLVSSCPGRLQAEQRLLACTRCVHSIHIVS